MSGGVRLLVSKANIEELRRSVADMVIQDLKKMEAEKVRKKTSPSYCQEFAEKVPLTGLSDAIRSKRKMSRVLWTLVFVVCFGAAVYFVYKVFEEYMTDPTATKVNLARLSTFTFPQLVLCLDTWLNAEKAFEMGLTKDAIQYGLSFLIAPPDLFESIQRQSNSSSARREFDSVYRRYGFKNLVEFYEYIALDAVANSTRDDEITFTCDGCEDRRLPKMVIDYDVCYKIRLHNVDGKLRQSYGWYQFVIRVPDLSQGMTRRRTYWRLYTYLNPSLKKLVAASPFVSISRGHTHTIRIASERFRMISKPKEPCVDVDDHQYPNYSALSCAIDCISKDVQRYSNCTVFNFEKRFKRDLSDYCNTYSMEDDWGVNGNESESETRREIMMRCVGDCQPECNVWRYHNDVDTHVSGQLIREAAAASRRHHGSKRRNVTAAKMYFINADVLAGGILQFIEVYTYSFETLVGNIGGTCGIWIGVSILTVVQLVSFCSKRCIRRGGGGGHRRSNCYWPNGMLTKSTTEPAAV